MNLQVALDLADDLLYQFKLQDWHCIINGRPKRILGKCVYARKQIQLMEDFVRLNPIKEVEDTIRHEIAHALVGTGHGHNLTWRLKAIEIGARPVSCNDSIMPAAPWIGVCPGCAHVFSRYRKPKQTTAWCMKCGAARGRFRWERRLIGEGIHESVVSDDLG